jgi:transcriptional regulator with XRE-family HTH domain
LRVPLGQVVRAWRQERKLTLEALATAAGTGFTRGYLSQVETGSIQNPSGEKLAALAAALQVDPLVLVLRQFPGETQTNEDQGTPGMEILAQGPTHVAETGMAADLSYLVATLAKLPVSRQQQYVDALAALVERLTQSEPE